MHNYSNIPYHTFLLFQLETDTLFDVIFRSLSKDNIRELAKVSTSAIT